ncbi:PP2C family protein-serine/threonine phosphatase [Rubripirellula reticaptiva]|uniref:Serine/threonine phosphatase stp n=1 Tax=Rubripirellula reticaptiva TaxID=2528013 RepID=A0A5C6EDC4_9BACT|nr:protein phosphatase 2C domain-containing protein [Rubripirellula reticaptiva]TWU46630.1 Serine/threonine phosphatase stp [Rubripirellula reticaptiva]
MSGQIEVFGISDQGRVRPVNDDQFMIADLCKSLRVHTTSVGLDQSTRVFGDTQGRLLLVADGMGKRDAGERASQIALDGIVEYVLNNLSWYLLNDDFDQSDFEQQLKAGLRYCRDIIDNEAALLANREGMQSTLTLAYIVWPKMFVVHLGDSRCYLLRGGRIEQLTKDQSVDRGAAIESSSIDEDQFREEPSKVLWKIIGAKNDPHPEATSIELRIGDAIVLCTDGLTAHVGDKRINEEVTGDRPLSEACETLIAEANEAGGEDNITLVACRFRDKNSLETQFRAEEVPREQNAVGPPKIAAS